MNRRELIMLFSAVYLRSRGAGAQERKRLVGLLSGVSETEMRPQLAAFRERLGELGWTDGQKLTIELRLSAGNQQQMTADAGTLVSHGPDLILAQGPGAYNAVRAHSSTVPIVFTLVTDPVRLGLIASLARPGGYATGLTNFEISIGGKWLELLRELAPQVSHIMVVGNAENPSTPQYSQLLDEIGRSVSIEIATAAVRDAAGIETAIETTAEKPGGGLIILPDFLPLVHRELILRHTIRHHLPAVYPFRTFPADGGLASYGLDFREIYRQAAGYVDRILRGTKPADLPVQAPNKFELVINLKAAKSLGLDVPATLIARADEVIE